MSNLPKVALPTDALDIGGQSVEFRSLSRSEVLRLHSYEGREDEAEDFIVSAGTGCSIEEAHEWRQSVDVTTAGVLVDAIIELSGLTDIPKEEAAKPLKAIK